MLHGTVKTVPYKPSGRSQLSIKFVDKLRYPSRALKMRRRGGAPYLHSELLTLIVKSRARRGTALAENYFYFTGVAPQMSRE